MKANEAPEKIYLEKVYPDNGTLPNGLNYTPSPTDIEYSRTDTFIEKAISWLKEQNEMIGVSFNEDFLERFQKYMKGE